MEHAKLAPRKKINILPCSGIGKALGTLARWSALEIVENILPDETELLCLARLVSADEESKKKISENYNITLDGCRKACALTHVERNNEIVHKSYQMAKFLIKNRDLKIDTKNVLDPGPKAIDLAKRIAKDINKDIKNLLHNQNNPVEEE